MARIRARAAQLPRGVRPPNSHRPQICMSRRAAREHGARGVVGGEREQRAGKYPCFDGDVTLVAKRPPRPRGSSASAAEFHRFFGGGLGRPATPEYAREDPRRRHRAHLVEALGHVAAGQWWSTRSGCQKYDEMVTGPTAFGADVSTVPRASEGPSTVRLLRSAKI